MINFLIRIFKKILPGFSTYCISDGYHTFQELYDFREHYNALIFNEWYKQGLYGVHKSKRHHDGELCFGGDWFIVVADLPSGQITNHYPMSSWDLFKIRISSRSQYPYDGHTGKDVLHRIKETIKNEQ